MAALYFYDISLYKYYKFSIHEKPPAITSETQSKCDNTFTSLKNKTKSSKICSNNIKL